METEGSAEQRAQQASSYDELFDALDVLIVIAEAEEVVAEVTD